MASLKAKTTVKNLLKKGFYKDDTHHHYYNFWHDGKIIATTFTSHNDQDIYDALITAMSKQCRMDRNFFIDFAKCTKNQSDYIQHLKAKGEIPEKIAEEQTQNNNKSLPTKQKAKTK